MQRFQVPRPRAITYNVGLVGAIRDVSDAPLTDAPGPVRARRRRHGWGARDRFRLLRAACRGGSGGARGRHRRASGPRGGVFDRRGRSAATRSTSVQLPPSGRWPSGRSPTSGGWTSGSTVAGIYPTSPLLELSEEEWDAVLDVNLRGTFIGAREAARSMIAAGSRRRHRQRLVDRRLPRRRARRRPLRRLQVRGARAHAEPRRRARRARDPRPRGRPDRDVDGRPRGTARPTRGSGIRPRRAGSAAAARPRGGTRRRRPGRGLLRERPVAADDRQHAVRRRAASSPAERFGAAQRRGAFASRYAARLGPSKPSMSSVVTSGSRPSLRQTSGTARQYCSSAPKFVNG